MGKVEEIEKYFRETMGVGEGSITKAFNDSVSADDTNNMFTLAYQWQDKKHRHVRDLCSYVDALKDEVKKLEEENRRLKEYIKDCYIQEYAGARYSCKHCTRLEDQGHYSHCPIVRFGLEKEQSND